MPGLIITLVALSSLWDVSLADCPPEPSIRPCTCDLPTSSVACAGVVNVGQLVDVLNRSTGWNQFWSFALVDSSVVYLPSNVLDEKDVIHLVIHNSSMTALFDTPPRDSNKVMTVVLKDVVFQRAIDWGWMSPMKKLKLFKAENTDVRTLGQSFTDNIDAGLNSFILVNCNTRRIRHNAFAKLTSLYHLEITDSEIKTLNRSMFASPSALEEMVFSGNSITSLPDDFFSDMPVLKKVNFSRNKIHLFSEAVFGSIIDQLGYLGLEDNPLNCDCTLLWYVAKEEKSSAFDGRCFSPEDQKDKLVQDLRSDFDVCAR